MPEVVSAFPGKTRTIGAGREKPRLDWSKYADGAIHKLTSADYECDPKNLAGQVARFAKKNGKSATVELQGTDFYVQMTASATVGQPAAEPAVAAGAAVDPFAPQPTA